MDEQKAAEILGVKDSEIQEYLKKHPEKAREIAQSIIGLDETHGKVTEIGQQGEPLAEFGRPLVKPVYYHGFFGTKVLWAFLATIIVIAVLELIVFLTTGHL